MLYCLISIYRTLEQRGDTMYSAFLNPISQLWQTCWSRCKKDDESKNCSNCVFELLHDQSLSQSEWQSWWFQRHSVLWLLFFTSLSTWFTLVTRLGETSKHILSSHREHFTKFIRKLLGKMFQKHLKYQILNMKFIILLLHYLKLKGLNGFSEQLFQHLIFQIRI